MSWIDIDLCRWSRLGHKIPAIENLGIAKVGQLPPLILV